MLLFKCSTSSIVPSNPFSPDERINVFLIEFSDVTFRVFFVLSGVFQRLARDVNDWLIKKKMPQRHSSLILEEEKI